LCEFEGARVAADASSAHFSGVQHEYALDSLLRMLLSWALLPDVGFYCTRRQFCATAKRTFFLGDQVREEHHCRAEPLGSVLTDEISLLKRIDGQWHAFGTPFWENFRRRYES